MVNKLIWEEVFKSQGIGLNDLMNMNYKIFEKTCIYFDDIGIVKDPNLKSQVKRFKMANKAEKNTIVSNPDGIDEEEEVVIEFDDEDERDEGQEENICEDVEIEQVKMDKTVDTRQLMRYHENLSFEAAEVLAVHPDVAFELLHFCKWNTELLYLQYADHKMDLLSAVGIPEGKVNISLAMEPATEDGTCDVCFDDFEAKDILHPICGHSYCRDCWKQHILTKIDSAVHIITCMEEGCKCPISIHDVEKLCGTNIATKYHRFIVENNVQVSGGLKHCIRPNCPFVLTLDSVGLCAVATCECGQRICWRCGNEAHAPCTCKQVKDWSMIDPNAVLEDKWVNENTKPCPKCKVPIQKDGGCNHMVCTACQYQFCWTCGNAAHTHGSCNAPSTFPKRERHKDIVIRIDGKPINLDRAHHYVERYLVQKQSAENEKKTRDKWLNKVLYHFCENMPESQALELIPHMFNVLDAARSVLIWSYPYAFMLNPNSSEIRLFEHVQGLLDECLEDLTRIIEKNTYSSVSVYQTSIKTLENRTISLLRHVSNAQL